MRVNSDLLAEHCIKAALGVVAILTLVFWGDWFFILFIWLMTYPLALLIGSMVGFAAASLGATVTNELWIEDEDITVTERSPEIVGKLGEFLIHEWVLLKRPDNGEEVKLYYKTIVDLNGEWEAPNNLWFVVLEGGILYVQSDAEVKAKADEATAAATKAAQPDPEKTSQDQPPTA